MILDDLKRLGLREGDSLMVHASIRAVGCDAREILDALQTAVGPTGTVLVAAYHYGFAVGEPFATDTPSATGKLADVLRDRDHALRTAHPMFNFVVGGALARTFADLPGHDAFGQDSPFAHLCKVGGKILLLGVDYQNGFTFIHHVEQMEHAPHRQHKQFEGEAFGERVVATAFVRAPGVTTWVYPMGKDLDATVATVGRIGKAHARLLDAQAAYDQIATALRRTGGGDGYSWHRAAPMDLARDLWPLPRSLTGGGVRETLRVIARRLSDLRVQEIPSGTQCYDWVVPDEWVLHEAELTAPDGTPVVHYPRDGTICVVSYAAATDRELPLEDLQPHLHSLPARPFARPYVTSYYAHDWGFCLPDAIRRELPSGTYRARIDTSHKPGTLSIGVVDLPSTTKADALVLFSTNTCHPSLAINEISGLVVQTALAEYVRDLPRRQYAYRFLFLPETIGTLTYLAGNGRLAELQCRLVAGFCLCCMASTPVAFSPSRRPSLADRAVSLRDLPVCARHSDDRQYASPKIDLPVVGLYGRTLPYPEYHTSDDTLALLSDESLKSAIDSCKDLVGLLEANRTPVLRTFGEPMLSRRGLYPATSVGDVLGAVTPLLDVAQMCDGVTDLIEIARRTQLQWREVDRILRALEGVGVVG